MEDTTQGPRETQGGAADDGGTGGRGALNGEEPAGRGWGKLQRDPTPGQLDSTPQPWKCKDPCPCCFSHLVRGRGHGSPRTLQKI